MWAAIAGAFAVVIALAGVIGYLVNSYRGAEDGEDEAEARARASTDAAHDAELSLAKSQYDASSTIDNLRDEQAMLLADLAAEQKSHGVTKLQLGAAEKARDDLLDAISKGQTQAAGLAVLIRRDLERLRQQAEAQRAGTVSDRSASPGGNG